MKSVSDREREARLVPCTTCGARSGFLAKTAALLGYDAVPDGGLARQLAVRLAFRPKDWPNSALETSDG